MSRVVLTDSLWAELEVVMRSKRCKRSKNNRNVVADARGNPYYFEVIGGSQWLKKEEDPS